MIYGSCRGSVHCQSTLTRECFFADPRVGPADADRGSDSSKTCRSLPESLSRADASVVSYSDSKTPPNIYAYECPHPCVLTTARPRITVEYNNVKKKFKCRPLGRIRGSNARVGVFFLAGQGDPTRDMTRISRASRNLADRVGSFSTRFWSRGVRRFPNLAGRVWSGQLTRPDPWDLS